MTERLGVHPLLLEEVHQPHERPEVSQVELDPFQKLLRRLFVPARVVKREAERAVDETRERIRLTGGAGLGDGLFELPLGQQAEGIQVARE